MQQQLQHQQEQEEEEKRGKFGGLTGGESNKGTKEGAAAAQENETSLILRLEFGRREETKSVNLMLSLRSASF